MNSTTQREVIDIRIYKITCDINNKCYIGQTGSTIEERLKKHFWSSVKTDTKFYRAIRKYGKEHFHIEEIDQATTQDELDEKEIFWIRHYNSTECGYNTKDTKGKCGGDTLTNHPDIDNIKSKLRESKLGDKNPMRINGGLKGERNGMYGKRGKDTPSARACVAIHKNGEEVLYFDTLQDMQKHFNVTTLGMVTMRCRGKTKSPYNDYYFKYIEDYKGSQSTIERVS